MSLAHAVPQLSGYQDNSANQNHGHPQRVPLSRHLARVSRIACRCDDDHPTCMANDLSLDHYGCKSVSPFVELLRIPRSPGWPRESDVSLVGVASSLVVPAAQLDSWSEHVKLAGWAYWAPWRLNITAAASIHMMSWISRRRRDLSSYLLALMHFAARLRLSCRATRQTIWHS